jgi:methionine-S-sulfoxide reductase
VGYAGGEKRNPTYYDLGDHTETVQVDYDPTQTSYEGLLAVYFSRHNGCAADGSRQYMSAVFYHNDTQRKLALDIRDHERAKRGASGAAQILPMQTFYVAEDYHQKYVLRQDASLMKEFKAMYPDPKDFMNSTAAARINGYLVGHGSKELIQKEIDQLGLSPEARQRLFGLWDRRR